MGTLLGDRVAKVGVSDRPGSCLRLWSDPSVGEGIGIVLLEVRVARPVELLLLLLLLKLLLLHGDRARRRVGRPLVRVPRPRVARKRVGGVPRGHRLRDHPGLTDCRRCHGADRGCGPGGGGGHGVGDAVPAMGMGGVADDGGQLLLLLLLRWESGILRVVHLRRGHGGRGRSSASAIIDCGAVEEV